MMREEDKAGHRPPHAEVCISFWVERAVSRELQAIAHKLHTNKSVVIRDALLYYFHTRMARATDAPQMNDHDNRRPL